MIAARLTLVLLAVAALGLVVPADAVAGSGVDWSEYLEPKGSKRQLVKLSKEPPRTAVADAGTAKGKASAKAKRGKAGTKKAAARAKAKRKGRR